ncbi:unnamed protein product [Adineta steineri]|uniref:LIM zinc-binding domain-containing protein n=1 Tax=Adineta steineri TaxID=433720 RepID=A0A814XT57_9BILA|nr:unnamed protein product [Adineta steineri]CAF1220077.1 unnamed protein product [Adineta steineri]
MEILIENTVWANTRCFACGALVYDVEKKKTANHIYHNRCFCCRICKRNLTAATLNEEGDDIYCTNCYRKKQRGDCNSIEFQRAASERATYVYNERHPDQPSPTPNPQPPVRRDFLRNPSWTLRQLERQFLSQQPTTTTTIEKAKEDYIKISSLSHPMMTIKTNFSNPIKFTKFPRQPLTIKNEPSPSPSLHFSPAFSPFPNNRTESGSTTPNHLQTSPKSATFINLRSRLHRSSTDLTKALSPIPERNSTSINSIDSKENKKTNGVRFQFPDVVRNITNRRSFSATDRRKIK